MRLAYILPAAVLFLAVAEALAGVEIDKRLDDKEHKHKRYDSTEKTQKCHTDIEYPTKEVDKKENNGKDCKDEQPKKDKEHMKKDDKDCKEKELSYKDKEPKKDEEHKEKGHDCKKEMDKEETAKKHDCSCPSNKTNHETGKKNKNLDDKLVRKLCAILISCDKAKCLCKPSNKTEDKVIKEKYSNKTTSKEDLDGSRIKSNPIEKPPKGGSGGGVITGARDPTIEPPIAIVPTTPPNLLPPPNPNTPPPTIPPNPNSPNLDPADGPIYCPKFTCCTCPNSNGECCAQINFAKCPSKRTYCIPIHVRCEERDACGCCRSRTCKMKLLVRDNEPDRPPTKPIPEPIPNYECYNPEFQRPPMYPKVPNSCQPCRRDGTPSHCFVNMGDAISASFRNNKKQRFYAREGQPVMFDDLSWL